MSVTRDIHSDIADIMEDAARSDGSQRSFSTEGWTEEQLNCLNGLLQYGWNRGYKMGYQEGFEQAQEASPAEPTTYSPDLYERAPYFECTAEQWERHTKGMTTSGQRVLANMLAHHCLLARRDDLGWILTRFDLITSGKPWWHVSNDGVLTYDYDPQTKARTKREPTADTPTPEELNRIKDFLLHIQKCLHRNKEYAPVVTWELQAMIAILNADRETLARMDTALSLVDGPRPSHS